MGHDHVRLLRMEDTVDAGGAPGVHRAGRPGRMGARVPRIQQRFTVTCASESVPGGGPWFVLPRFRTSSQHCKTAAAAPGLGQLQRCVRQGSSRVRVMTGRMVHQCSECTQRRRLQWAAALRRRLAFRRVRASFRAGSDGRRTRRARLRRQPWQSTGASHGWPPWASGRPHSGTRVSASHRCTRPVSPARRVTCGRFNSGCATTMSVSGRAVRSLDMPRVCHAAVRAAASMLAPS